MNYQHNFTCRLFRDWRHWSNWRKKHLFLAHGLRAQSIMCVRWRRQDDENDALVAPWGTWWSHCVLRHEAEWCSACFFLLNLQKSILNFYLFTYLFIVHLSGCAHMHSGTTVYMWRSEDDNMLELTLSFLFVGPRNWTRVLRHSNK